MSYLSDILNSFNAVRTKCLESGNERSVAAGRAHARTLLTVRGFSLPILACVLLRLVWIMLHATPGVAASFARCLFFQPTVVCVEKNPREHPNVHAPGSLNEDPTPAARHPLPLAPPSHLTSPDLSSIISPYDVRSQPLEPREANSSHRTIPWHGTTYAA